MRHGKFLDKTIYDKNEYILHSDHAEIILLNKYGEFAGTCFIDIQDVSNCKKYKWHIRKSRNTNYAITTLNGGKPLFIHRLLLDYDGSDDIDHLDHNGLNNRKSNLCICSHSKNLTNQHNYDNGIYKVKSGRYRSTIVKNGKTHYIGTYDTMEEALLNRKIKEKELFD